MSERTVTHDTFTIERTYAASPARVFAAWADPAAKRVWFAEGDGWELFGYDQDFRVGGKETSSFRFKGGDVISNDTTYLDIVPEKRIVFAYTMVIAGTPMSASLGTAEFVPEGTGTKLVFTEHDAFFDGIDKSGSRKNGCAGLLVRLDHYLKETAAA